MCKQETNKEEFMSDWARVIDLVNSDGGFRSKLKQNPALACADAGCFLTPGMGIRVIEQCENEVHFILGAPTNLTDVDRVLESAEKDPFLRTQLLENATQILSPIIGHRFPSQTKFIVHDRLPQETIIILRDTKEEGLLDESQLDSIAGGLSNSQAKDRRPNEPNGIIAILIG
jgi:hypothetical protein